MPELIPVIGLEIHVELKTKSKMFCSCPNDPDNSHPNTNICPICLAHPGTLPTPNQKAIEWTALIGRALGCSIRELSKFDRKHYFYPDLPKGYQISQYDEPIAEKGELTLELPLEVNTRDSAVIGIQRAHLEEDTAKLTHEVSHPERSPKGAVEGSPGNKKSQSGATLVDFNRAGVPLVEIVTYPNFKSAVEAKTFAQELQTLLRYLKVSDADMEKGQMRVEANVSVQEAGKFEIVNEKVKPLAGYVLNNKVEVKNINSFRAVEKAIEFEIKRQTELFNNGESWSQQTRGWDDSLGGTVMQRIKENAEDYRYFPEPDIPPFNPLIIAGETKLPELPQARRARFKQEYGFSYSDAKILTDSLHLADFTENVMSELTDWLYSLSETTTDTATIKEQKKNKIARLAGGWITSKLLGLLNEKKMNIRILKISAENFAELVALVYSGRVNSTNAQKILGEMLDAGTDIDPTHIMEEKGYGLVSDENKINDAVQEVIRANPKQAAEFRAGKEPLIHFLKGMVMKTTEGGADPAVAEKLLREQLKK